MNQHFSISEELQKQLIDISEKKHIIKTEKTKNINNKNSNLITSDTQKSIKRPNYAEARSNQFHIDYSYINSEIHHSWVNNLKYYNNEMINLATKNSPIEFRNFCSYSIKSIEASLAELFDVEFTYICSEDNRFLKAYNYVYLDYEKKKFTLPPKICIEANSLKAENYKKIGSNTYIDKRAMDLIIKNSQQTALDIFFSILNVDYINNKNLRTKYFFLKKVKKFRDIESHGSNKDVEDHINKLDLKIRYLYFPKPQYEKIKDVVEWFVQEVYKRISQITIPKKI